MILKCLADMRSLKKSIVSLVSNTLFAVYVSATLNPFSIISLHTSVWPFVAKRSNANLNLETLGDYYGTLNYSILTETRDNSDACNPGLTSNRKRKLVILNEGQQKGNLVSSTVKLLTGGYELVFRNLYAQSESAPFLPKLGMVSNFPPTLAGNDNALHNRMYPIDFNSEFKTDVVCDEPEAKRFRAVSEATLRKFYCDKAPLHMLLMIRYAKQFLKTRTLPPIPMASAAMGLILDNSPTNVVNDWLNENYEPTDGEFSSKKTADEKAFHTVLNFQDLYASFVTFLKTSQTSNQKLEVSKKEFDAYCRQNNVVFHTSVKNQHVGSIRTAQTLNFSPPLQAFHLRYAAVKALPKPTVYKGSKRDDRIAQLAYST